MRFPLFYLVPKVVPQHYKESEERKLLFRFICYTANTAGTCLNVPAVYLSFQLFTTLTFTPVRSGIPFNFGKAVFMTFVRTQFVMAVGAEQIFPVLSIQISNVRNNFCFSLCATLTFL